MDQARHAHERARYRSEEAKAESELKTQGYRTEEIAEAKAAMQFQQQEGLRLQDELLKRTIIAPFAGFLVVKESDVGQWVERGGTIATIVDLTEVDVVVNVD